MGSTEQDRVGTLTIIIISIIYHQDQYNIHILLVHILIHYVNSQIQIKTNACTCFIIFYLVR